MDRPDDDWIVYEQDAFLARLDAEQDRVPAGGPNGGEFAGGGASGGSAKTQAMREKLAKMKEKTAATKKALEETQSRVERLKAEHAALSQRAPSEMEAHATALKDRIREVNASTGKIERGLRRGED